MNCINCNEEVSTKYCAACGQINSVKKITLVNMWHDFLSRAYGFDGMFPRTLRDLTIRPGVAAREYIAGNRVKYYGPVGYFFLMITVCLLLMSLIDVNFLEFAKGFQRAISPDSGNEKTQQMMQQIISDNLKTFAFFVVPFQGIAARYFLFRKSGINLLENMVLPFYTAGHMYWLSILISVPYKYMGINLHYFTMVVGILYIGYAYSTMMNTYQSRIKSFFKGIGVFIVGQLLFMVAMGIVITIVVIIWSYMDKEGARNFFIG